MKDNIFIYPTKKVVLLLSLLWLIAIGCSVLSMTDLFRERFFSEQNLSGYPSLIAATIALIVIYINCFGSDNLKKITTSKMFLLMLAFVISLLSLVKPAFGLYTNLGNIGTDEQWRFIACSISFVMFLFIFLAVIVAVKIEVSKNNKKKILE